MFTTVRSVVRPRFRLQRALLAGFGLCLCLLLSAAAAADKPPSELPAPALIELTPMERDGHPEGNALLRLGFEQRELLPDSIELDVDTQRFVLKRDEREPLTFVGIIKLDFDRFADEIERREALIRESGERSAPLFEGREMLGEKEFQRLDPRELKLARLESLPLRIPRDVLLMPLSFVDPARELMITSTAVVNDPTRTFDICGNSGNPNGAWTFKTLMSNMANTPLTGVDPADFVERWLRSWQVNHTLNSFAVPARGNIGPLVLNSWPRINGKLDLNRSPFRLLAIVNRVDLRGNSVYGASSAGEGRFVFGVVNRNLNGGCSTTPFTVILEYGVPVRGCSAVRSYGQQWADLGGLVLGSAAYNAALQSITDQFTSANAAPNKPNGSAINQVRTNENALNPLWELREFVLQQGSPLLRIVSTQQTPHHTLNNGGLLANYITTNAAAIVADAHTVPPLWLGQPFLSGSNFNFSVANGAVWNAPGVANQPRHKFSLATCNACHGGEARDSSVPADLPFVHIGVRQAAATSALSRFLVGTGSLSAPSTFNKPDPINLAPVRQFGDLLRRQQDLANLTGMDCSSGGFLQDLRFEPLRMVH
ncbi:MAG: hypothetical protein H4O13_02715 [Xanthomonadales bacterium]|nr:hypothetical protein [Xanthomonadales bacterium]